MVRERGNAWLAAKRDRCACGKTMVRDTSIEELLHGELRPLPGITRNPMIGGWAWSLRGNLLRGAKPIHGRRC